MCFKDFCYYISKIKNWSELENRKNELKTKKCLILNYFAKQKSKESREIDKQEAKISRATCSTSVSHSTKCDSTQESINLDKPNIVSDDVIMILFKRSTNIDINFIC